LPLQFAIMLLAYPTAYWINRYYRRVLGEVRRGPVELKGWRLAVAILCATAMLGPIVVMMLVIAFAEDPFAILRSPPAYSVALCAGVLFLVGWWVSGRVFHGKLVGALVLLAWAGALSAWSPIRGRMAMQVTLALFGTIILVDGLINHMRLMRSVREMPAHDDGAV
jgi:hypothetical protein